MKPFDFSFADLHRHLDGSLRPETILELAKAHGYPPPDLDKLRFKPRMGLGDALDRFGYILSLLQHPSDVRRVAAEICEDAAADGVKTLEIRFAPQLHVGAPPEEVVEAAVEGAAGRAGIILCGLHGDPPEVLEKLVEIAIPRNGVVGIDLAGCPTPHHRYTMKDYVPAFRRAEKHGIGRTVHAGEGGPATEVRDAIELLHAQRIGHGTMMSYDMSVVELARKREVVFEVCPTSNVHTGVIPELMFHPLNAWFACGIRAVICPDNTFFSNVTSSQEHLNALTIPAIGAGVLRTMAAWGHEAAFRR